MATLDDKLLGEKLHYYCSSSEEEDNNDDDDDDRKSGKNSKGAESSVPPPPINEGPNTGPKGVIEDWRRFKQLETEKRAEQEAERREIVKRLAMTCRSEREDREAKEKEDRIEEEFNELLDEEEFLQSFIQQRMREMMQSQASSKSHYGVVAELLNGDEFLSVIDSVEDKNSVIVIFIYEKIAPNCKTVVNCVKEVAKDYPNVKFCTIEATSVGLSKHFKISGVPAILTYKGGELIASFVRITETLGDDFYSSDLESFLIENQILMDKELAPSASVLRGPARHAGNDDDSD